MLDFDAAVAAKPRALLTGVGEFSDLEETDAGVRLMLMLARATRRRTTRSLRWIERLLPVAERLRMRRTSLRPHHAEPALLRLRRPTEGLIMLRGGHELAVANDLEQVHRRSRTILTFHEQFADPPPA